MRTIYRAVIVAVGLLTVLYAGAGSATAQDSDTERRLKALEERIRDQDREIERLRGEVATQRDAAEGLASEVESYLGKNGAEGWWAEPNTLRAFWKDGLRFESAEKDFSLALGGRVMFDITAPDGDDDLEDFYEEDFECGYEFRRVWFYAQGDIYDSVFYKSEYELAGEEIAFRDMYIGARICDTASFQIGNMKEPFSLEELTSSKYITFMERSLPNAFAPTYSPGARLDASYLDGTLNGSVGWFFDNDDEYASGVTEHSFTGRIAYAPWYEEKGERLAHIGASVSLRNDEDDTARFRQRPEVHNTIRLVDTGTIMDVDGMTLLGFEAAVVYGPFSVQGEYVWVDVDSGAAGDPTFTSYYVYGSWFITGERRPYKGGTFGRVRPLANFMDGQGGTGAWEVGLRYSMIDLTDGDIEGGEMSDITFGLNWYLNPVTRVMFNYVFANVERGSLDADFSAFQLRCQIDF